MPSPPKFYRYAVACPECGAENPIAVRPRGHDFSHRAPLGPLSLGASASLEKMVRVRCVGCNRLLETRLTVMVEFRKSNR